MERNMSHGVACSPLVLPPLVAAATLEESGFFYVNGMYVWGEIEMGNGRRGGRLMRRFRYNKGRFDCQTVHFRFRGLRNEESTEISSQQESAPDCSEGEAGHRRCAGCDAGEKEAMGQPVMGPTNGK